MHMNRLPLFAAATVIAIAGLQSGNASAAGITTTYTVNLTTTETVSNLIAIDNGPGGFSRITYPYSLAGPGTTTLVNPQTSAVPVTSYFLIGLYSNATFTDHIFLTMTPSAASANAGILFSTVFPGYHETPMISAVKAVTSGLPDSDPSVIAGLATINSFAFDFHSMLFINMGDTGIAANLTPVNGGGTTTGASGVPLPAGFWTGASLLSLLGLARFATRFRRHPVSI